MPPGREIEAGREVGRFHILTHCYWREGGAEFRNVNIMARRARHREGRWCSRTSARSTSTSRAIGIPVLYTNVFWGGRSEIKPSEISPVRVPGVVPAAGDRFRSGVKLERDARIVLLRELQLPR